MKTNNLNNSKNYIKSITKVYYPSSGNDIDTLQFILNEFPHAKEIFFCDYLVHISTEDLATIQDWEVIRIINLFPSDFGKQSWGDFWFENQNSTSFSGPKQNLSNLFILYNKITHNIVRFFQLGTEGVGTYRILKSCDLNPNLIFLADHGFGGNWHDNYWGQPAPNYNGTSYLKSFARYNNYIMVDKITNPWTDFTENNVFHNSRWTLYYRASHRNCLNSNRGL